MTRTETTASIVVRPRRPSFKLAEAARASKVRNAEELADVETTVSRAALLLRSTLRRAA